MGCPWSPMGEGLVAFWREIEQGSRMQHEFRYLLSAFIFKMEFSGCSQTEQGDRIGFMGVLVYVAVFWRVIFPTLKAI